MYDKFAGRCRDSQSSGEVNNALSRSQELPAARYLCMEKERPNAYDFRKASIKDLGLWRRRGFW